jgi:hypothetical protein
VRDIRTYLGGREPGPIGDTDELERLLAESWHRFDGADEAGMAGYKLRGRMERAEWRPPRLTFVIERHGGTVLGSTRADLQHWKVDLDEGTAEITRTGHRQLVPAASAITADMMRAEAERLADLMDERGDDDRVRWYGDGSVKVVVGRVLPDGPRRTVEGRRRRFRPILDEVLMGRGWEEKDLYVYRRRAM